MPGLTIHSSNRLEHLAAQLAQSLREPLAEPFAGEVIVVQSGGMARWLTHEIALRSGVCMNIECPFLRVFVERVLRAFFPEIKNDGEFAADVLAWRIDRVLPAMVKQKAFAEVRRYLNAGDGLMRFQLAEKIAETFDRYLIHRPAMLMDWERGGERDDWQAILWRELGKNRAHAAALHGQIPARMALPPHGPLPERVSVFGISSLPALHLRVLFELSRHCDVRVFSLQPAREYFGHDLPPKQRAKLLARLAEKGVAVSENTLPEGNPLLASMGRLHRDFIELRIETDEQCNHIAHEVEQFAEPAGDDLLHVVQGDILDARTRGADVPKKSVAGDDGSIEIHACHSPMREVEVLHDRLLAMFDADATLRPRDVIVMTPDIEKYAPFVQAVFDCPETESRRIPFSIADRHPRSASATVDTFLALLDLAESRCTASEIFSLLERAPIRHRFAFTDDDLETIRRWIAGSGIRWGIDGPHRDALDLPALDGNSWRSGLDRLLLGYAMAGGNRRMFDGIMPCDDVEGTRAEVLGRFVSAVEAMFRLVGELPASRPLAVWPDALVPVVAEFFSGDDPDEASDLRSIRTALDRLRQVAALAGGAEPVEFRVVRHHLTRALDEGGQRGGFLTGRVTFCALQPNRSIPARVVALIGMDDQAFPRQARPPAFDKMTDHPLCGDRSIRDEDRATFLEAIVSARDRLHISFVGRSARDNEELPPAVPVSELLDYLDRACEFPQEKNARDFVVTGHRLHAFSPVYFSENDARHFSYSESNAAASRALLRPADRAPAFVAGPLPEPDASARNVELRGLVEFFRNPSKHFLRRRLGLTLDETDDTLDDIESFALDPLESYSLKQELFERALSRENLDAGGFRARGVLPLGATGAARFLTLRAEAAGFAEKVSRDLAGASRDEPLLVTLSVGGFSLAGKIESLHDNRLVLFRCAKLKPKDRISAWISHLALCASREKAGASSLLIGTEREDRVEFAHTPNASELLARLLDIYWRGQSRPLPFFPASAFAFANAKDGSDTESRLKAASAKWTGNLTYDGERADAWFAFCFGDSDPMGAEFAQLAGDVFFPMLGKEADA